MQLRKQPIELDRMNWAGDKLPPPSPRWWITTVATSLFIGAAVALAVASCDVNAQDDEAREDEDYEQVQWEAEQERRWEESERVNQEARIRELQAKERRAWIRGTLREQQEAIDARRP